MGRLDNKQQHSHGDDIPEKVKFEVFGGGMIEKYLKSSGNPGPVYLPPEWIGMRVKAIRL